MINTVILGGNLTKDIELRYTPSGKPVADFTVAINEGHGQNKSTLFVDVTVWDKQAENCSTYIGKGSKVLVEGRLKRDEWNDRETGKKRKKLSVVAFKVTFLDSKSEQPQQRTQQPQHGRLTEEAPAAGYDEVPF